MDIMADIQEQLRNAARASGLSIRRLALQTDTPYQAMHRFIRGYGGVTMTTGARLARLLRLELRPIRKRKKA